MIEEGLKFFVILLVTAVLAGLIVYLIMRGRLAELREELESYRTRAEVLESETARLKSDLDTCLATKPALEAAEEAAAEPVAAAIHETNEALDSAEADLSVKQQAAIARVQARAAELDFDVIGTADGTERDDLKIIKGIGPFIETKLNALGIYQYEQIANFTSEIEEQVNEAIEFFPGRVKRDDWTGQAEKLAETKT